MAPIIVERATMASPRASSRFGASPTSVTKSFSMTSVIAAFVSFPDRAISLPRAAKGQMGVRESR